jgi:hypothetical protein
MLTAPIKLALLSAATVWRGTAGRRAATNIVIELPRAAMHSAIDQSTVDGSIRPRCHGVE